MDMENTKYPIGILAPVSGWVIPLETVEDTVFSRKLLGDGIALVPEEGTIYSPVDGIVETIFPTLHAYTFSSRQGQQILVHVGLGTIALEAEGFRCFVQPGDTVKAGQPIGEVDLALLKARNLDTVTMLTLCEGAEGLSLIAASGCVNGGEDTVLNLFC